MLDLTRDIHTHTHTHTSFPFITRTILYNINENFLSRIVVQVYRVNFINFCAVLILSLTKISLNSFLFVCYINSRRRDCKTTDYLVSTIMELLLIASGSLLSTARHRYAKHVKDKNQGEWGTLQPVGWISHGKVNSSVCGSWIESSSPLFTILSSFIHLYLVRTCIKRIVVFIPVVPVYSQMRSLGASTDPSLE